MNPPIIEVSGLSLRIGEKALLEDITFQVSPGERLAILGPNGAGKTTLLKCLSRLLSGFTGSIEIHGKPMAGYSQRELAQHLSYVPQADGRMLLCTVEDFVVMARYPRLNGKFFLGKDDKLAVVEAMRLTGTLAFAERRMNSLSGGERQKVFIAAALAQGADTLLLDEPTTFLDYRHQAEVLSLLRRLSRDEGVTAICVTHDLTRVVLDSDRVLALKEGQMAFWGAPEKLLEDGGMEDVFGTSFDVVKHPRTGATFVLPSSSQ